MILRKSSQANLSISSESKNGKTSPSIVLSTRRVFDVGQVIRLAERLIIFQASSVGIRTLFAPSGDAVFSYTTYPSGQSTSAGCSDRTRFENSPKRRAKIGAEVRAP